MSAYLLDTHVLIWALSAPERLSERCRKTLTDSNEVYVSAASLWEMSIKAGLGKLTLPTDFSDSHIQQRGYRLLDVTAAHALAVRHLPTYHKDPFDRLLVVQAQLEQLTLVTIDKSLDAYDVSRLSACE